MRLPVGKLPSDLLARLLERHRPTDPRLILGPGIGLDCAVIDFGERLLVAKSDPITFTAEAIGWYAVHVNANDVATTGAKPRWFLATLLLPQDAEAGLVDRIFDEIREACDQVGAQLVGGHTEITSGLDRPIVAGAMLAEVDRGRLITPRGARPGDHILLSKGVPIEGASILAREFADRLGSVPSDILDRARGYLRDPGISVVKEALAAAEAGGVTAMHDPTEGGVACGLWELAEAAGIGLEVDVAGISILPEAAILCQLLGLDPLATIASGALLLTVEPRAVARVLAAIEAAGVPVAQIGRVVAGTGVHVIEGFEAALSPRKRQRGPKAKEAAAVSASSVAMRRRGAARSLPRPDRDALARLLEQTDPGP